RLTVGILADGDRLGVEADPLGQVEVLCAARHLTEEVGAVVQQLELEAGRLADDLADFVERRLVLSWDLDDDVFVPRRDRSFSQTELVHAAQDDLLGLRYGGRADL